MRNTHPESAFIYARRLLRDLLTELSADGTLSLAEGGQEFLDPRIRQAIHFLRDHFAENIGVPEIAEFVNLHTVQFRSLFLRATGLSPYQYLLHYRLQKAAGMLAGTTLPLDILANACGFRGISNFCQAFKKHYGSTPGEYRRIWNEV